MLKFGCTPIFVLSFPVSDSSYIEKKNEYSDEKSIALLIASYGVYYIIISSSKLETNLADYKA
jgi:hypothetical protein